jgi:AraC family transcriptional regulator
MEPAAMTYQPKVENRSADGPAPPRETDLAIAAGKPLEDVRIAPEGVLGAANRAPGDLAAPRRKNLTGVPRASAARGGFAPWQKRQIGDYIERHLDAPILVEALAKVVSLSASHFCRAFKESFDQAPHTYIIRRRLERAQELMLATPDPLSQIAIICGHTDQAHFSRRFRQQVGETPNAWRRRHAMGHGVAPDRGTDLPVRDPSADRLALTAAAD